MLGAVCGRCEIQQWTSCTWQRIYRQTTLLFSTSSFHVRTHNMAETFSYNPHNECLPMKLRCTILAAKIWNALKMHIGQLEFLASIFWLTYQDWKTIMIDVSKYSCSSQGTCSVGSDQKLIDAYSTYILIKILFPERLDIPWWQYDWQDLELEC